MVFGSHLGMAIYQKILVVTTVALKRCPSSKLFLGPPVTDRQKLMSSSDRQIFANPESQSKRKRRATLLGVRYTEYQPEMIFL